MQRHPFIAAISFCIVLLFLAAAAVSAQPQPLPTPRNNLRPRRGGHHGPHQGHHRPVRGRSPFGRATPRNRTADPNPNQNQPTPKLHHPPIPNLDEKQNQNPATPSPPQGEVAGNLNGGQENSINPGKLFGWVPRNEILADSNAMLMDEFLHAHNWVRSKYNQPPYMWDENLATSAHQYLTQRYFDCKMIHSELEYGENLFWGEKLHWTPSDAVYYWYMEKEWYDFNTLKCSPPTQKSPKTCGHFTQLVWRDSVRLGCALQHCRDPNAGMLIACEYDPPGNFDNENPLDGHVAKIKQ